MTMFAMIILLFSASAPMIADFGLRMGLTYCHIDSYCATGISVQICPNKIIKEVDHGRSRKPWWSEVWSLNRGSLGFRRPGLSVAPTVSEFLRVDEVGFMSDWFHVKQTRFRMPMSDGMLNKYRLSDRMPAKLSERQSICQMPEDLSDYVSDSVRITRK